MASIKKPALRPVFLCVQLMLNAGFGRSDWIRTSDLLVPNETRYQAALRSEDGAHSTEKVLLHKTLCRIFLIEKPALGESHEFLRRLVRGALGPRFITLVRCALGPC